MSKSLNTMARAAIIMLGLAAMGSANARTLNHNQPRPGYDGPVYSSPSEFVPGRSIVDDACDLPTSPCSNDERISN